MYPKSVSVDTKAHKLTSEYQHAHYIAKMRARKWFYSIMLCLSLIFSCIMDMSDPYRLFNESVGVYLICTFLGMSLSYIIMVGVEMVFD